MFLPKEILHSLLSQNIHWNIQSDFTIARTLFNQEK